MTDETQGVTLDILLGSMYQMASSIIRIEERLTRIEQQLIFMANVKNPIVMKARYDDYPKQVGPVTNRGD